MMTIVDIYQQIQITIDIDYSAQQFQPEIDSLEQWIPFTITLQHRDRIIYSIDYDSLTLIEIENMVKNIDRIIDCKRNNQPFEIYEFLNLDTTFELDIRDMQEKSLVIVEFWQIGNALTSDFLGYKKGFQCLVDIKNLIKFNNSMRIKMTEFKK